MIIRDMGAKSREYFEEVLIELKESGQIDPSSVQSGMMKALERSFFFVFFFKFFLFKEFSFYLKNDSTFSKSGNRCDR